MLCHNSNGIDGSSIRVSTCILWWVETRFLEPFRDPTYNWFWVLKPKWISGLRISKFEKVYLCMGEVNKIPIDSCSLFYCFWPPIAKIAMCLTKQNPSFWSRPKWCFHPWGIRGGVIPICKVIPRVQWNQWFFDLSLILHSMGSQNSLPKAI